MEKISIITSIIPSPLKKILKGGLFVFGLKKNNFKKYGGHPAVTRSLIAGLEELKINFNYNPQCFSDLGETVVVLSGEKQLLQMIKLKKTGVVKKLIAGPNITVLADDYDKILASPEIDICITPSEWVKNIYELDCPELIGRVKSWPAGIDIKYWKPSNNTKNKKNILFYDKRPEKNLTENCKKYCKERGYNVEVLVYGKYKIEEYKQALERNSFLIHFVEQESQGISLAESWAMNVPTMVWNPGFFRWGSKNYLCCSAPYLTGQTGTFFRDFEEFKKIEESGAFNPEKYSAKEWLLQNLTDEKSAQRLLDIINAA